MLADLGEPGIKDGSSLIAAVRADYPNIKVLIAAPHDGQNLEELIDGILSKPYDASKVAHLIKILLDP
jgi:DNA-binding NarL/FixJ family response regulator